ncbi:MAG: VCBS repeat-containing protein [Planctomycetota bacterium]
MLTARLLATTVALATYASAQTSTFAPPALLTTGVPDVTSARAIDVDTDGDLDVVACSQSENEIVWFENEGGTTIVKRRLLTGAIHEPLGLVGADLDGDGDQDLVVSARFPENIWRVENLGGGAFGAPEPLAQGLPVGARLQAVDLDGDGDLDVIVPSREGYTFGPGPTFIENLGGGALATPRSLSGLTNGLPDLEVLDVDSDGALDLVTAGPSGFVNLHRGVGLFEFELSGTIDNLFVLALQIESADLDGDGDRDLVVTRRDAPSIAVYESLGGGSFGPRIEIDTGAAEAPEIALVDVDADGDPDMVTSFDDGLAPRWIETAPGFTFVVRGAIASGPEARAEGIEVTDLDGDGRLDLLIATEDHSVDWIRGSVPSAAGIAFEPDARRITFDLEGAIDVVSLDVDIDGDLDVVAASPSEGLALVRARGVSGYDLPSVVAPTIGGALELATGDVDGDGNSDLVVRDAANQLFWLPATAAGLGAPVLIDALGPGEVVGPVLADVDADGDVDLLTGGPGAGVVGVHDQVAAGSFGPRRTIAAGSRQVLEIDTGDLNADGVLDVVTRRASQVSAQITWHRGLGGGQFAGTELVAPRAVREVVVADVDFDPNDEVVWITDASRSVMSADLDPAGGFSDPRLLAELDGRGRRLAIGSVDGDVRPDLLVLHDVGTNAPSEVLQWWKGNGSTFIAEEEIPVGVAPTSRVRLVDVDRDGDEEVLLATAGDDSVRLLDNLTRAPLGVNYCGPSFPNASGKAASMRAIGSGARLENDVQLQALDLPPGAAGLFLASLTQGLVANPGGSAGTLCLGGAIGRFAGPGQVGAASQDGVLTLRIDLTAIPQPTGSTTVMSSDLWRFQAWYRDVQGGAATSNFTDALAVVFL